MRLKQQNLAVPVGEKDFEENLSVLRAAPCGPAQG